MDMTKWNEYIIAQYIRLGRQKAMLRKAQICIDRSSAIMVGLSHQIGRPNV